MAEYAIQNTVIHLLGFPGTGKYTIAREMTALAPLKLVDNHLVNNTLFSLLRVDGRTPLPLGVWPNISRIWEVVADTMVNLCPPDMSFVLTNALVENDPDDRKHVLNMRRVAEARLGLYVPVRLLLGDLAEHERRIVSPDRAQRMKETDPARPRYYAENREVLRTGLAEELSLDTGALSPAAAARLILEHTVKQLAAASA